MEKQYTRDVLCDFEIKILTMNKINGFMPMSVSSYEEKIHITHHCEDHININFKTMMNPYELLDVIEKIVVITVESNNHLIPIQRYELKSDFIYKNMKTGEVKILFAPVTEKKNDTIDFNQRMLEMLNSLCVDSYNCRQYLERVIKKIEEENPTRRGLLNCLGELKRECHICGWNV